MLTPQEVSGRSFTKMVMGGYNMTQVDEFLDELTEDYTSLYKENASLKAKMKVLVEKVEEYRATEESMRATLLTAQRMADSIVKEAEAKRDEMIKTAEAAAREKLEGFRKEMEEADRRLRRGQDEFRRFIDESRTLCMKEMDFLDKLPELDLNAGQSVPVEEIESNVLATETAEAPAAPAAPVVPVVPEVPAAEAKPEQQPAPPVMSPVSQTAEALLDSLTAAEEKAEAAPPPEDLSATRRVNIKDLKFGPNYRGEN